MRELPGHVNTTHKHDSIVVISTFNAFCVFYSGQYPYQPRIRGLSAINLCTRVTVVYASVPGAVSSRGWAACSTVGHSLFAPCRRVDPSGQDARSYQFCSCKPSNGSSDHSHIDESKSHSSRCCAPFPVNPNLTCRAHCTTGGLSL
jgi:hypothetical protein